MKSFFFYDLETSGLSPREDRIMQFAGQRTDLDLNPIGDPINFLVKMDGDTLPSPDAIMVTKITPQKTLQEGISELELSRILYDEIFTPETIIIGYNNIRFDDEFLRFLFWRNFHDPYRWQWADGRSKWDILDLVRITRALRGEGINWPVTPDGKPTNRLELITKANGISHESAHDAFSDVSATISVARLIKEKQPKLFSYFFTHRDKTVLKSLLDPKNPQNVVYTTGRYGTTHNFTSVVRPIAEGPNGSVWVFDLRYNFLEYCKHLEAKEDDSKKEPDSSFSYAALKKVALNRCPFIAPLSILSVEDGWKKLDLSKEQIETNQKVLEENLDKLPALLKSIEKADFSPAADAESALYDSFLSDTDAMECEKVRNLTDASLAKKYQPKFTDARLSTLYLHFKAKNFPSALTEDEQEKWEKYRINRLKSQSEAFISALARLQKAGADDYLLEELQLYYSSLDQ